MSRLEMFYFYWIQLWLTRITKTFTPFWCVTHTNYFILRLTAWYGGSMSVMRTIYCFQRSNTNVRRIFGYCLDVYYYIFFSLNLVLWVTPTHKNIYPCVAHTNDAILRTCVVILQKHICNANYLLFLCVFFIFQILVSILRSWCNCNTWQFVGFKCSQELVLFMYRL